jgi:hypothetical protein
MGTGFIRSSFYPFFPWDQTKARDASVKEVHQGEPVVNAVDEPKSILKVRLAKGEITTDEYKHLVSLLSK